MRALLLSAGLGTRFRPYTERMPKPAIPLLNLPLGLHPLLHFESKISRLVVNLHYMPGRVQQVFRDSNLPFNIEFSFENDKPLGSGGAIWHAQNWLKGDTDFWYINGDEVFLGLRDDHLDQMIQRHRDSQALATIMVTPHPEAGQTFGAVCVDENSRVTQITRKASLELNPRHFVGVMLINEKLIDILPEGESNVFYDCIVKEIAKGRLINAFEVDLDWYEMGNFNDYLSATKSLMSLMKTDQHADWQNKLRDALPDCEWIVENDHIIWKHKSAEIHAPVTGFAVLGKGASVEAPIHNTIVYDGVTVESPAKNELIL